MFQSNFFKNIAFLSLAGLIGKVAAAIALPILARLYSPESFGMYSIYFALLTAFPLIATLRLDFAVTISREKNTARILAVGALILLFIVSVATIFILWALIAFDILPFGMTLLPFICFSIFMVGGCDVLRYWGVRYDRHTPYGKSQVAQSFSLVILQISLFYLGADLSGLVVGDSISRLIMFSVLFFTFKDQIFTNIKWESFFRVIKAYILRFITYTITNLLHITPNIVLPIFIASVYSKEENGYYLLGYQVIFSITGVFISSLSQVFLGKIAHLQKDPAYLLSNLNKVVCVLAVLGLPCLYILSTYGPDIYVFVFGEKWEKAGQMAQVLAPAIYAQLVLAPVLSVFIVLKQPHKQLVIDFVWACMTILCLYAAWYYEMNVLEMLSAFSNVTIVIFTFFYIQILYILSKSKKKMERVQ